MSMSNDNSPMTTLKTVYTRTLDCTLRVKKKKEAHIGGSTSTNIKQAGMVYEVATCTKVGSAVSRYTILSLLDLPSYAITTDARFWRPIQLN